MKEKRRSLISTAVLAKAAGCLFETDRLLRPRGGSGFGGGVQF